MQVSFLCLQRVSFNLYLFTQAFYFSVALTFRSMPFSDASVLAKGVANTRAPDAAGGATVGAAVGGDTAVGGSGAGGAGAAGSGCLTAAGAPLPPILTSSSGLGT